MLISLCLNNIVVFETASLEFSEGLNVITGETGAGKSTILSALSLVMGVRADMGLIRTGTEKADVTAIFEYPLSHKVAEICKDYDIPFDGTLIIRRILRKNRPARSYVNDVAVTAHILTQIANECAEICGQFEDRSSLSPSGFREMLDKYLNNPPLLQKMIECFEQFKKAQKELEDEKQALKEALREQDYLRHVLKELDALAPQEGEETELADIRSRMIATEKNAVSLQNIEQSLTSDAGGIETILLGAIKALTHLENDFPEDLPVISTSLNDALEKIAQATTHLARFNNSLEFDPVTLGHAEERLFALRAAARKHHVMVDDLPRLHHDYTEKLALIDHGEAKLQTLEKKLHQAEKDYWETALELRTQRLKIVPDLEKNILKHLQDLNLGAVQFRIRLEETSPQREGADIVVFELSTGSGMAFGAVHKTASGGEMSRFMLASKAALSSYQGGSVMIFDEIDRGVGGATAEAVGIKLRNLTQDHGQVIVITHSPQVAAKGKTHFHIAKQSSDTKTHSVITHLDDSARREEIARMLAGTHITDEARAAAEKLL